ncbi:hypothetical protein [Microbacterium sp. CPCC 204701]|uniref:hypothetical protein n=1 Tax=Microbacterium sp. CPCC 204701 TaxID=2493084 RepID=UPI000FD9E657|nr:hypothetical protein [Microbacterium sp. CPCC 204701]
MTDRSDAAVTYSLGETAQTTRIFSAHANSEGRAIVDAVLQLAASGSGSFISEIAGATHLSRFSASRHLAVRRGAGILSAERSRSGFRHRVNVAALTVIEDWAYSRATRVGSTCLAGAVEEAGF